MKPSIIQLPNPNSTIPRLLNVHAIERVDYYDGTKLGGGKILLRLWVMESKKVKYLPVEYKEAEQAMATYWQIHAMLHPASTTFSRN